MNPSPFFTIITASLNSGKTIRRTLVSIRNQSFQNLEHIVVDGGSCDNTIGILKEFSGSYNLNWISEPDKGIADALNKGLHQARGHYIMVIQADDQLAAPDILEKVFPVLKDERLDICSFPVIMEHPDQGRIILKPIRMPWWNHFKGIFLHQGSFVHKRVFDRIGEFNRNFSIAMDYDFFYRALMSRCTIQFESTPVAVMGGKGIGTTNELLMKRLSEEFCVQKLNEKNPFWRLAQLFFRIVYLPYKTRLLPLLRSL